MGTIVPSYQRRVHCQRLSSIVRQLIVIKSTSDNIFGGFASMEWNSTSAVDSKFVHDPLAFILSLVNQNEKPFKALRKTFFSGIFCDTSKEPAFGEMTSSGIPQFDLSIYQTRM